MQTDIRWTAENKEKVVLLLTKGYKRISQGWTQHAFARNIHGQTVLAHDVVDPDDTEACAWCATGAVLVNDSVLWFLAMSVLREAIRLLHPSYDKPLVFWNDEPGRTWDEVKTVFQRAMILAQTREVYGA